MVAWLLALAAPAAYLLWPDDLTWWMGILLVTPVVALSFWRQEQKGFADQSYGGGSDGGPWAPPPDSGGV